MRRVPLLARAALPALLLLTLSAVPEAQSTKLRELRGMLPPDADYVHAIALEDLDGDGDLDAVLATAGSGGRVLLGDGNGGFTAAPGAIPGPTGFSALEALDVDGDGDLDLVFGETALCTSGCTTQTRLFLNDGLGAFTDATAQLPAQNDQVEALASGDVDGDGDLDLLLGQDLVCQTPGGVLVCSDPQTRLFLNGGAGTFTDATAQVPVDGQSTEAVALADLDGDGDLDAILGNSPGSGGTAPGINRLWRGDGLGGFAEDAAALPAPAGEVSWDVSLVDVDGDGDLDLATATAPVKRLYLNDGAGGFTDASNLLPPSTSKTYSLAHGDVDGDGDEDLFVGNIGTYGTCENELFVNDGSGLFADASAQIPLDNDQSYAVVLADVDGDGDLDALQGSYKDHQTRLYLNDGAGLFVDVSTPLPADSDFSRAICGDVDGDRDVDVLVLDSGPSKPAQNRLLRNDGTGVLVEAVGSLPADDTRELDGVFFDADGDGDLDAALGGRTFLGAPMDALLVNDGTGVFTDASGQLPPASSGGVSVSAGDIEGDGDQDLLFVTYSYELRLLANDGAGVFTAWPTPAPGLDYPSSAELGDVDGDGALDIVVLDQQNRVLFNDGTGTFTDDPTAVPAQFGGQYVLRLGDLDGDGDLDLVTDAWKDVAVLVNDGSGRYAVSAAPLPPVENHPADLALADFDGDGLLDLFVANSSDIDVVSAFERQNRIYLGDGLGGFAETSDALPVVKDATASVSAADFDGDGDVDAFVAGMGQERVYLNLARQLARRAVPRIGKPLTLDLYGSAGMRWTLLSATGPGKVSLGALGTLLLDPGSLSVAGHGTLDAEGRAALTLAVPASPGLVGRTLLWQALVGQRLSNLERTTATDL